MRSFSCIVLCAVLCAGCSAVFTRTKGTLPFERQQQASSAVVPVPSGEPAAVPGPEPRLPAFERLTYEMKWVGMPVGTMVTSVLGIEKVNGRDAYVLEATARTNAFCSAIYRIQDRFVSYLDVENLHTLRHEVHRREGNFKKDAVTEFDQLKHKAYFTNFLDNSKTEFDIPPSAQDTVSAAYYFMLLPMKLGDRVEYSVCNNEKNYRLWALIGERGMVKLGPPMGTREVFSVEPFAELSGERIDKGRVSAYYSWDNRRIPLYAVIKAPVLTSVTLTLIKVETSPPAKNN